MFLTIYLWSISVVSIVFTALVCFVAYPFVSQRTFARIYEYIPATIILYAMMIPGFWSLKIKDLRKNKSWDNKQYIIVANHVSFIDSLISCCIPLDKKYMVAEIFTRIPVFGWLCRSSGHVPVDRHKPNNREDPTKSGVMRALKAISDGSSFLIYPEGMRTLDPYNLCKFKTGAFQLAKMTGIEILPLTLNGTREAMPIGGVAGLADIRITIGEPFVVTDVDESVKIVKSFIENTLKRENTQ